MITNFLHKTMLLAAICLGCISCSDETAPQQTMPDNSNGQVKIVYKIAGASSLSRAETTPEPGWSGDWHENLITRIDLFVFTADGDLYKHIEATGNPLVDKTEDTYTTLETDELTYEEVIEADYTYYMVANCPQLADIEETGYTFSDLESAMITPALDFDATQESFVMDGIGERSGDKLNITLSFNLARAATKVCLAVVDEEGTDITNECKYRFFNYVSTGTSVMAESEKYGEGTNQSRTSMMETEAANFIPLKYEEDNKHQVVFYSYPNDWFDTSKLGGQEGAWTIQDYASQDPIISTKQTYILLTAPYGEDGKSYYYKIPVNFATYTNNDKVSFTDAELEEIRDLYRMKRNHIYDITAKIDRRGGGLDLVTRVHEWYDGGSIDINYAGGENYTGVLEVISDTPLTTGTGEDAAYAVVYGDNDKVATFTFRMTTPAGATWTANLTNGSQFELASASGMASGVGVGDTDDPNEGLVTFSVRPTQDFDTEAVHETELYITVTNANGEPLGEQIINPDEEYPGSTTRIKIRQVSLDQWNSLQ